MAYKFRIYPDGEQARLFRRTIGCCRLVYNTCLEQKRLERHRSDPRRLSAIDQNKQLADLKAELP
ncbi:helix-turn-helix domain-containing protein, partial [Rhizobium sullae]|uniref:helix-turn-helix domain-containing protein n=1 Tax=Rhizobium sullae TaxID=50338 RepID=UPI0015C61605